MLVTRAASSLARQRAIVPAIQHRSASTASHDDHHDHHHEDTTVYPQERMHHSSFLRVWLVYVFNQPPPSFSLSILNRFPQPILGQNAPCNSTHRSRYQIRAWTRRWCILHALDPDVHHLPRQVDGNECSACGAE